MLTRSTKKQQVLTDKHGKFQEEIDNMEDDFFKLPMDTCLYVDFNGEKYTVLRNGTKEYGIGEMLCEMGNVSPSEIKEVLFKCGGLVRKPTVDQLGIVFVELDGLLTERFGVVAGAIIGNELISMTADYLRDKKEYIKTIEKIDSSDKNGEIYKFIFIDSGYSRPGDDDVKQVLLTAYFAVANSLVAFKYLYTNAMKVFSGAEDPGKDNLKIMELFGSLVATQHIDYKIMLFEDGFANVYGIKTALSLLAFEFANAYNHNVGFAKCKNCDRYFVLTGRQDAVYCSYPAPNHVGKTCRDIGAQVTRSNKEKTDIATGEYRKLYMRLKMQSRRHPKDVRLADRIDSLVNGGKEWRGKLETGAATTEEFLQWLETFKVI